MPQGDVVTDLAEALAVAAEIGYPVAVKPLAGHKGIGVTANVQEPVELAEAFARAGGGRRMPPIIVETSLAGSDYRLLCVNGRFVAALRAAAALDRGRRRLDRRAADRARERHAGAGRQPDLAHGQDHHATRR